MLIEVKQEHIDKGTLCCTLCPIALAIRSKLYWAWVSPKEIRFSVGDYNKSKVKKVVTPDPVRRRINYCDRTGKMKPFSFELEVPSEGS